VIFLTGGTGFIGRHVARALCAEGLPVRALVRDPLEAAKVLPVGVELVRGDIHAEPSNAAAAAMDCGTLVHLAWPGLPNYKESYHLTRNLIADLRFLASVVERGVGHVLVAGTCLEYGMQYGPLEEDAETSPTTPYGLAKDTVHRVLAGLARQDGFRLQWLRLFYTYGEGQNPRSLLAQLDAALARGDESFDMSAGEQLRDYLAVEVIARIVAQLVQRPDVDGAINCCSGRPTSVRRLVEERVRERGASLRLNLGRFAYPEYEPLAFWGIPRKLRSAGLISGG
jgi:dTDP-6-deoxy-L-talose 4-dehydrogenase (NAD+)